MNLPEELHDQSVIRDLEHFVEMNGENSDIGKIMEYHDGNVSSNVT